MSAVNSSVPVVLEVWAAGTLACSSTAMLLPFAYAPVVEELKSWLSSSAEGFSPQTCEVLDDLVEWMRFQFQSNYTEEQQQQQQQQHENTNSLKRLELMANVGGDLLHYSRQRGLSALAGSTWRS
jgi:ABC-type transport system involved in cytochrome bd biosynthesis fused ATPase/permease subunit